MRADIPVTVHLRVNCAKCGYLEDETFAFDMPVGQAAPEAASEPGRCPQCGAAIQIELRRTPERQ